MNDIRIIKAKEELEGTCYMELLPGTYKDKCWNDGSLFFDEEVFGYIEPIFKFHITSYDHYAFIEVKKDVWLKIIEDLKNLRSLLQSATSITELNDRVGFIYRESAEQYAANFLENNSALSHLISELLEWLCAKICEHESITILGM